MTIDEEMDLLSDDVIESNGDEARIDADYPDAAKRRKPTARGTFAAEIAAQAWIFADYIPTLGPVWDRLFDDAILSGKYAVLDVQLAAFRLLQENYELTDDEAVILIRSAAIPDLVKAVEAAMIGPEKLYRSHSDWVVASLAANGLTIADVPPQRRAAVLDLLVATRRTVPMSDFVSSAEAAKTRSGILNMVNRK